MRIALYILSSDLKSFVSTEDGQDLIEYALIVALIAFAAVTSMQTLAADINNAFLNIANSLTNAMA